MEAFRFHITLTNRTYRNLYNRVRVELSEEVEKLNHSRVDFGSLCLLNQADRRQPFTLLEPLSFAQ